MNKIYTVGHSNYNIDTFVSILNNHSINVIVDVRSTPYSKYNPQYNKEVLDKSLKLSNITYIHMGEYLGAKYDDKELLFEDSKVNFSKVNGTQSFLNGIERLKDGMTKGYRIALMCAEKDPFECHRFGLISEYMSRNLIDVFHIMEERLISNSSLEERLLRKYEKKLPKSNIFTTINKTQKLIEAYKLHNKNIAYRSKE